MTMVISYGQSGKLDDNMIKEEDLEAIRFKKKEHVRFKEAVGKILELQKKCMRTRKI